MELIEKVELMQKWLRELSYIKEKRKKKIIDDIDSYDMINKIIKENENELKKLEIFDVFEYAKEYYLLQIQ